MIGEVFRMAESPGIRTLSWMTYMFKTISKVTKPTPCEGFNTRYRC